MKKILKLIDLELAYRRKARILPSVKMQAGIMDTELSYPVWYYNGYDYYD